MYNADLSIDPKHVTALDDKGLAFDKALAMFEDALYD